WRALPCHAYGTAYARGAAGAWSKAALTGRLFISMDRGKALEFFAYTQIPSQLSGGFFSWRLVVLEGAVVPYLPPPVVYSRPASDLDKDAWRFYAHENSA
ncbi:hypothetical protein, partial [Mailhella massiliensis]